MNQRSSFLRKVVYGGLIAALLFPLSLLSAPATVDSPGGTLAQLRTENGLSQADLGEIDPASETIKLATLGLRGVAVQMLWNSAIDFKKKEDWDNLRATLEQLAKLQPNFITFWKYQSWNLSYNVSVEFDDYRDRYYWVREGIQFLQDGVRYNRDSPALLWELGWVLGQKIGRSDEKELYRRLFRDDDEYHPEDRPPSQRDNWLLGKILGYAEAIAAVDERGKSLGKKSPALFYSGPAKWQMNHAEAIENEGLFGRAVTAWGVAADEWFQFGQTPVQHSTGPMLRLGNEEALVEEVERLQEKLSGFAVGDDLEKALMDELTAGLSDEQREALETPENERTEEQQRLVYIAESQLKVTPEKLAAKIEELDPALARDAKQTAADLAEAQKLLRFTENYKSTTNYDYWKLRCDFEQTPEAVAAREKIYQARIQKNDGDPFAAEQLYEESFDLWAEVLNNFPDLKDPRGTTGDDLVYFIYEYKELLDVLDSDFKDDFPLWEIVQEFDSEQKLTAELAEWQNQQRGEDESSAEQPEPADAASDDAADETSSDTAEGAEADAAPSDEAPGAEPDGEAATATDDSDAS